MGFCHLLLTPFRGETFYKPGPSDFLKNPVFFFSPLGQFKQPLLSPCINTGLLCLEAGIIMSAYHIESRGTSRVGSIVLQGEILATDIRIIPFIMPAGTHGETFRCGSSLTSKQSALFTVVNVCWK